jgi:NAD(P)-dependent dehydrogenase (short-subunit alcohol dehydrogenase family)
MSSSRPVALVTGAAQGLGLGTARELARNGFDVVVTDVHPEVDVPEGILEELRKFGTTILYQQLDIADLSAHQGVLEHVADTFGRLDSLINNAGIATRPLTDILDISEDMFDRAVDINLRGTFFLTQAYANLVIKRGWTGFDTYRSIVIVSSIAAEMVNTDRATYCVTKSALTMVTKLYAQRLAEFGIHVHEVRPGFMSTAMTASAGNTIVDDWIRDGRVPIARWGNATDIGETIATLALGKLPYMTGQPIWVAGGLNLAPAP